MPKPPVGDLNLDINDIMLRDYFAMYCMSSLIMDRTIPHDEAACEAYKYADAMLLERKRADTLHDVGEGVLIAQRHPGM